MDTFGFSMGGLISRCYNVFSNGDVHNMVIVATPNHGTFNVVNWLRNFGFLPWPFYYVNPLAIGIDWTLYGAEGTADMLDYNDRDLEAEQSTNPTLYMLNLHPYGVPKRDLTLIAGNHSQPVWGLFLGGDDDSVVPVKSVFCRTSDQHDAPNASLFDSLLTGDAHREYEDTQHFTHYNFGHEDFRTENVLPQITQGLSDWVVSREYEDPLTPEDDNKQIKPDETHGGEARATVKVEFNTNGRDIDRTVLVIYARDGSEPDPQNPSVGWFIPESPNNGASSDGTVVAATHLEGNSKRLLEPIKLRAYVTFPATQGVPTRAITKITPCVIPLKPGQTHVPLDPLNVNFAVPEKIE